MKLFVCGKGGSGKSTVAWMLARGLRQKGMRRVLLIDADESNHGLHRLMGVEPPVVLLQSLGGKKGLREKMKPAFPGPAGGGLFKKNMTIDELPENCVTEADGVCLLTMGKVTDFGEGCACPIGGLSRTLLSHLMVGGDEAVVVDTEAGVEHFGRRIGAEADLILGILDPTYESSVLARKMADMARAGGIEIRFVLNKVDERVEGTMAGFADPEKIIARLPYAEDIFLGGVKGEKLSRAIPEIDELCKRLTASGFGDAAI